MIGELLRTARRAAGKTAAESAKHLNLTVHAYRRYERGEVEPKVSQAIALAELYEISLDELLTDKPSLDDAQRMLVSVQPGQRVLLDVSGVARPEQTETHGAYKPKISLADEPESKPKRAKRNTA